MRKFLNSPLVRLSFGLVMLTVSMLLITDFLGLVPDTKKAELQSRKIITESLAVQLSTEISAQRFDGIEEILRSMVVRNEQLLSAAVRMANDKLLAEAGDHQAHWTLQPDDKSTMTQVHVPLFGAQGRWGSVELSFTDMAGQQGLFALQNSFLGLVLFVGVVGFLAYLMFLKRAMHELNPDSVIPERVGEALNTLAEGLLILDQNSYIVFSNSAFADKFNLQPEKLLGKKVDEFNWQNNAGQENPDVYPWVEVLAGKQLSDSVTLRLNSELNETFIFSVKASPISATKGKIRGVLITFDDITEVEAKNDELWRALQRLENSKKEITRQNQELQVLAARDPLTGALNRRSLYEGLDELFAQASEAGEELSCIMVDIDHFKLVNDQYGHSVGDEVIKLLTRILTECSRSQDLVARMGGEEFIVVLPETGIEIATGVAERMRQTVEYEQVIIFADSLKITSSFGVATLTRGAESALELIDQSDKALYSAKENGRNRVVCWPDDTPETSMAGCKPVVLEKEQAEDLSAQQLDALLVGERPGSVGPGDVEPRLITPVPSRVLLLDRIDQGIKRTQRDNTQLAVLIIDVGDMPRVNNTLGVAVGEKLTKIIITRLKQTLRLTDTISMNEDPLTILRLAGNEIAVLLTDLEQADIVTIILKRVFAELKEPIDVESSEVCLNASVGVSVYPDDGRDPETLIRNASSAMHDVKQEEGRNDFRFYSEDINRRAKKQIQLEAELYRALERDELAVCYQPKVDLLTGEINGMEALVRWRHPQLGLVLPNDFIHVVEQTGLIGELSRWVLCAVCRQINCWQQAGHDSVTVAVNLSGLEFRNPKLGDEIIAVLQEFGVSASALEIEVTETAVIESLDVAAAILEQLSRAGVGISVDDFGTGHSSLNYLKRFPLRAVKIDRSFISDFMGHSNDASIVSAIIAMSHSLGLRVVAEGVETEEQLRFLQDLRCDEVQGYLIARPMASKQMSDLLAEPGSIRRLILKHGHNNMEMAVQNDVSVVPGMLGVLNDFSATDTH